MSELQIQVVCAFCNKSFESNQDLSTHLQPCGLQIINQLKLELATKCEKYDKLSNILKQLGTSTEIATQMKKLKNNVPECTTC